MTFLDCLLMAVSILMGCALPWLIAYPIVQFLKWLEAQDAKKTTSTDQS